MQVARILFAAAFTFLTSLLLGKSALKMMRAKLYRSEELFFGFVLGAACLSNIVLLVSLLGLAYWWVFAVIGCAALALAYGCGAIRFTPDRLPPLPRPWTILFVSLYGVFGALYFMNALSPEASSDGALFHVALPALYLREHRIPAITTNFLASLSEGMEMLFLFAFSFGKHSAAAMVHLLFALLMPLGMLSYARRIGAPVAGVAGSLLFFLSPAVGQSSATAYVDVAVAAVCFAVFYLLQIWWDEQDRALLVPLGLLAGFGYSIKYTTFLAVPYAVAVIALRVWRLRKPILRPCAIVSFCALGVMSPWIIKNAIVVGNPVAPLANGLFRNPYMYVSTEQTYKNNMGSLKDISVWRLPYEITTRGERTQGLIGPVFLLAPVALAALTTPAGRQLLCAAAMFLLAFPSYPVARILFPALPFIALSLGLALSRWKRAAIAVVLLHAVSAWPGVIPNYASRAATRPEFPDWSAALRLTPEAEYIEKHLGDYDLDALLDAKVPAHQRIFSFNGFSQAYHSRQVLVEWQSAFGVRLGESLRAALEPALQPVTHFDFHFEPRAIRKVRLLEASSVTELRIFKNGSELPRSPGWRVRAFPNPWDVRLAFDNSPMTRWASREPPGPGVFIEVDFGRDETIDQVSVECTPDQAERHLALDGIPAKANVSRVTMPERLRRAAIEELERQNVQWLVINDQDPGARDFQLRQAQWGITLAGEAERNRLYRLQ